MSSNSSESIFRKLSKFVGMALCFCLSLSACSGGGGGSGGSDKRTTETAVRILHGAIDGSPLTAFVGGVAAQTAHFAELKDFSPVERASETTVTLDRARSNDVRLSSFSTSIEQNNEYTLFVWGSASAGTETSRLIVEPIETPDSGMSRIRLLNALEGSSELSFSGGGSSIEVDGPGSVSDFTEIPSGISVFTVRNSSGSSIASVELEVEDQSEISFLVTGSLELGVVYLRSYVDFD